MTAEPSTRDGFLLGRKSKLGDGGDAALRPWMRIDAAAQFLGMEIVTLRRAIERHARRDPLGRVHSDFDGLRARKVGRHWRVQLDACWCDRAST